MKRISILLLAALALFVNACERHSAEETRQALEVEEAESGDKPEAHAESTPGVETKPAANSDTSTAPAEANPPVADPAKAPKFIPDSK